MTGSRRERAWALAVGQYGYITTAQAAELGVPAIELVKMARRDAPRLSAEEGVGRLRRVAYGIYHFQDVPTTAYDQYFEAVLRVGRDAHLTGDAVLSLHNLALVNPRRIRVCTPHRVRPTLPPWIDMRRGQVPPADLTLYEMVPSVTVARAIRDCIATVPADRLRAAVDDAVGEGLIRERDVRVLRDAIDAPRPSSSTAER